MAFRRTLLFCLAVFAVATSITLAAAPKKPKTKIIDTGEITAHENETGTLGPFDLDGFDTVSYEFVLIEAPPSSSTSNSGSILFDPGWENSLGHTPTFCSTEASAAWCTSHHGVSGPDPEHGSPNGRLADGNFRDIQARYLGFRYRTTPQVGSYTFRLFLYLRRIGS